MVAIAQDVSVELLTTEQVAKVFKCSPSTVMRMVRNEGLPCVTLNKRCVRFDPRALRGYIDRQQHAAAAG